MADQQLAIFVSCTISDKLHKPCILATLPDVNRVFFDSKGYSDTLHIIKHYPHRNTPSKILLDAIITMLLTHQANSFNDIKLLCVFFKIPAYHLLLLCPDKSVVNLFLSYCKISFVVVTPPFMSKYLRGGLTFKYYTKSRQNNYMYRHYFHILILIQLATLQFTRLVLLKKEWNVSNFSYEDQKLYKRIEKIIITIFSTQAKCSKICGNGLLPVVFIMYKLLLGHNIPDENFPDYSLSLDYNQNKKPKLKVVSGSAGQGYDKTLNTLEWFFSGKWGLSRFFYESPSISQTGCDIIRPPFVCSLLDFPKQETVLHINVQVAHLIVHAKHCLGTPVLGRSLVRTVEKKKCVAASVYKNVESDEILHTPNSINFNIHGYDILLFITILNLEKNTAGCSLDRQTHTKVSHLRSSTNSLQHGILDINSFRWDLIQTYPEKYTKLKGFPAVMAHNIGLVHRESVLIDEKDRPCEAIDVLKKDFQCVSEMDFDLQHIIYDIESKKSKEIVDNHILAMVKLAHFLKLKDAITYIKKHIIFDRLLIAQNPKMCKSEFADKSKFDAESKGKASKKIKSVDKTKDRKGFITRMNLKYKDLFIDPANTNTRGKWAIFDRIHHSPDKVFYSKFIRFLLQDILRKKYPDDLYPKFNSMLNDILEENEKGNVQ